MQIAIKFTSNDRASPNLTPSQLKAFAMERFIVPLSIVLIFTFLTFVQGQDPRRENRRAFVEELLRGLIESQTQKQAQQPHDYQHNRPGQPNFRQPRQPAVQVDVSRDMLTAREHLKNWNKASMRLVDELRYHQYEAPQLRPLMADALKLQANIELISRKAQLYPSVDPLVDDFGLIDRDWRVLSHRLKQTRGLPTECSTFISTISDLDTRLCGLLNIEPQIDRRELQRLATELRLEFDHLLQDVYYLVRGQQGSRKLLAKGKNLQMKIAQTSALVRQADYETIVKAYQQSTESWKKFSRQLHRLRDDRLRHSIAEIETIGKLIHEQLWLPVGIDREYLASMANSVTEHTRQVFDSISLTQLLAFKQPTDVIASAREFQEACNSFSSGISSGTPVEDLEWDYRLFEVQWNQLQLLLRQLKIVEIDHQIEEIEFSMDTLKRAFGDAPAMAPSVMNQLTADLDALGRQTSLDIHRRITSPKYDRRFHDNICNTADQFSEAANRIHQRARREPKANLTRQELNDLFVQWESLKSMMEQCRPQDKLAFAQYRSQIEPLMVKLQVVFAD